MWNLVNKGQIFRDLLFHPVLRELLPELLGEDYMLSSFTANIAAPGGEPQPLHSDQGYAPRSTPFRVVVNTAWMLEDHSEKNGGTRLVPGSHLWPELPADKPDVESIAATGPAGTMLMFDGRIWHGTGLNRSKRKRHLLLGYFCRPWIRTQENFTLSLLDEVYETASPELLGLLGFRTYGTLGNVNGVIRANGSLIERGKQVGMLEGTPVPSLPPTRTTSPSTRRVRSLSVGIIQSPREMTAKLECVEVLCQWRVDGSQELRERHRSDVEILDTAYRHRERVVGEREFQQ